MWLRNGLKAILLLIAKLSSKSLSGEAYASPFCCKKVYILELKLPDKLNSK